MSGNKRAQQRRDLRERTKELVSKVTTTTGGVPNRQIRKIVAHKMAKEQVKDA